MLHEFLTTHRDEILARSRASIAQRQIATPTEAELANGLPIFLTQLAEILRTAKSERGAAHSRIGASATLHGGVLHRTGLTVAQVVHDYGSICQTVTELAEERGVEISAEEFHTFNRCLDDAIADAVTEFERERDRKLGGQGVEHLGFLAHEMRNLLSTSMLTYEALSKGNVGIQGSTGTMLGRSLRRMRVLIDRSLAEVRLGAGTQKSERVPVCEILEEIEVVATIDAKDHDIQLTIESGPRELAVEADPQILASVIANLVQNAFKFTHPHGHITLSAHADAGRVLIDVEDECGGLPPGKAEELFRPYEQRGNDQTGLGLGLSISLKGVRASGGDIRVRDVPGRGCVFTVDLPEAPPPTS